jgi:hypothetical protein
MAKAEAKHTPTDWDLIDVLRYLTLAPLSYEIDAALREMEQRLGDGQLPLKVEHYVEGKLHSFVMDPFQFRHKYNLKLDGDWMWVVPRSGIQWGKRDYTVAEQDVITLWPPRPPAAQTAPDLQPEDKAGLDPFKTEAADRTSVERSSQKPLTTKDWLASEIKRQQELNNIPKDITSASHQIRSQMEKAVRAGDVKQLLEPRTIETHLRLTTSLFPKKNRSRKS